MFNSTHTFTGLLLARSGLDRWAPRAALTSIIAANLPDIDIVFGFPGSVGYIEHHRGITHSAFGIVVLTALLAAALYPLTKAYWKTFLVAMLAMATHPLLDYANTYGVQPLLPFSTARYYGDTLHVIDPYLDFILLAGIAGGGLLKRRRLAAWVAAGVALFYVGFRVELRDTARQELAAYRSALPSASRSAVFPGMIDPREFTGMIETAEEFVRVRLRVGPGSAPESRIQELKRFQRGDWSTPAVNQASATRTGTVFRDFARFPGVHVDLAPEGYRVTFIDFRFYSDAGMAFGGEVLLDRMLQPLAESLSFRRKAP